MKIHPNLLAVLGTNSRKLVKEILIKSNSESIILYSKIPTTTEYFTRRIWWRSLYHLNSRLLFH